MGANEDDTVIQLNLVDPPKPLGEKPMPNFRHGHRKRLKLRFFEAGSDRMPDYEILELVLFLVNRRKDMKPLAHRLLYEFKSFHAVLSADPRLLKQIKGVGDSTVNTFKIIEAAAQRMSKTALIEKQPVQTWGHLIDYCRKMMSQRQTEEFRVLFLDSKNHLIKDEVLGHGTIDQVAVYTREVMKRALELNASALILVHNHPSG